MNFVKLQSYVALVTADYFSVTATCFSIYSPYELNISFNVEGNSFPH